MIFMISKLAIIIINYNLKNDTKECINSFLTAGADLSQIILVDNGSSDDSVQFLQYEFGPKLKIIEAGEVRGYAHGLNLGIRLAADCGFEWMLLMSNDTIVDKDFLVEFERAVTHYPDYLILGPMILYWSLPDQIWFLGNHLLKGTMIAVDPYRMKKGEEINRNLFEVDFLNGCSMLVHRSVFERIGSLNASYFMYSEEVDFLWKARKAGIRMAAVPTSRMWHKISATMASDKPGSRYLKIRNQIWIYRLYGSIWQAAFMFFYTFFRTLAIGLTDLIKGQFNLLAPLIRGFIHGWFGRIPEYSF